MAAMNSQSIVAAGTTPSAITPSASDTIAESQFGPNGCALRAITTGTVSNLTILDPGASPLGNPGQTSAIVLPATGSRMILVSRQAINAGTGVATVTSSSQTGLTYELYRI